MWLSPFSPAPEEFHWQIHEDKGSLVLRHGKYSDGLFFTVLLENVRAQLSRVLSHVEAARVNTGLPWHIHKHIEVRPVQICRMGPIHFRGRR